MVREEGESVGSCKLYLNMSIVPVIFSPTPFITKNGIYRKVPCSCQRIAFNAFHQDHKKTKCLPIVAKDSCRKQGCKKRGRKYLFQRYLLQHDVEEAPVPKVDKPSKKKSRQIPPENIGAHSVHRTPPEQKNYDSERKQDKIMNQPIETPLKEEILPPQKEAHMEQRKSHGEQHPEKRDVNETPMLKEDKRIGKKSQQTLLENFDDHWVHRTLPHQKDNESEYNLRQIMDQPIETPLKEEIIPPEQQAHMKQHKTHEQKHPPENREVEETQNERVTSDKTTNEGNNSCEGYHLSIREALSLGDRITVYYKNKKIDTGRFVLLGNQFFLWTDSNGHIRIQLIEGPITIKKH